MTTPLPPDDPRRPPVDTPPVPYLPAPSADAPPPPYPQEAQGAQGPQAGSYPPPGPYGGSYGGQYGSAGVPLPPYAGVPTIPGGQYAPPAGSPYPPPQGTYPGEQYPPVPYPPGQWQGGYAPYGAAPVPDATDPGIGPERVPWHWYDWLLPVAPLVLLALTNYIVGSESTTSGAGTRTGGSRDLTLVATLVLAAMVYGLILLAVWWRTVKAYNVPWSALGVRKAPWWVFLLMVFPVYPVMAATAGLLGQWINQTFFGGQGRNPQIDAITGGAGFSWVALICAVLSAGIIAPIVEELLFRGMLYGWLRTRLPSTFLGIGLAVSLDAAIFGFVHGIGLILISLLIVGAVLALVYELTKSVLVTIWLHCVFNSVTIAIVFISLATGQPLPS